MALNLKYRIRSMQFLNENLLSNVFVWCFTIYILVTFKNSQHMTTKFHKYHKMLQYSVFVGHTTLNEDVSCGRETLTPALISQEEI